MTISAQACIDAAQLLAESKPLLCFHVDGEGCEAEDQEVLFARTSIEAKRRWANRHDWPPNVLAGISAIRKPEWDKHAPGPVPALEMIGEGWYFECHGCNYMINSDEIGERKSPGWYGPDEYALDREYGPDLTLPIIAPVELPGQRVFCCPTCRDETLDEERRIERMKVRAVAIAEAAVLRKWPGVTIANGTANVYVNRTQGFLLIHDIGLNFSVEGMKHGGCNVRIEDYDWRHKRELVPCKPTYRNHWSNTREVQPPLAQRKRKVRLYCASGDIAVWEAWQASGEAARAKGERGACPAPAEGDQPVSEEAP